MVIINSFLPRIIMFVNRDALEALKMKKKRLKHLHLAC